jgi:hypothetical protein
MMYLKLLKSGEKIATRCHAKEVRKTGEKVLYNGLNRNKKGEGGET